MYIQVIYIEKRTRTKGSWGEIIEEIIKEIAIMSELKGHTNIVTYEDHRVIPHEDHIGWDILIRMELLTSLLDYSEEHEITEQTVIKLGTDILTALEVCQKYHVVHRDIKPENIFVSATGDLSGQRKRYLSRYVFFGTGHVPDVK